MDSKDIIEKLVSCAKKGMSRKDIYEKGVFKGRSYTAINGLITRAKTIFPGKKHLLSFNNNYIKVKKDKQVEHFTKMLNFFTKHFSNGMTIMDIYKKGILKGKSYKAICGLLDRTKIYFPDKKHLLSSMQNHMAKKTLHGKNDFDKICMCVKQGMTVKDMFEKRILPHVNTINYLHHLIRILSVKYGDKKNPIVFRQSRGFDVFSPEELDLIRTLVNKGIKPIQMTGLFPGRSLNQVNKKCSYIRNTIPVENNAQATI